MWLGAAHASAGPLGEERRPRLVNGSEVYNVRFLLAINNSEVEEAERERRTGASGKREERKE